MHQRRRIALGTGVLLSVFLTVQIGAIALVRPFYRSGLQPVPNPQNPVNAVVYVGAILGATVVMLLAFRYGVDAFVRLLVLFSAGWLSLYVFRELTAWAPTVASVNVLAVGMALGLAVALYVHPEWYVIDAAGAVMGAAAAGLFGIGFGLFPALVLLVVLAVYDAISVYGTEHMLSLAEGVMDLRIPVVLVIPMTLSYSFLEDGNPMADEDPPENGDDAQDEAGQFDEPAEEASVEPAEEASVEPAEEASVEPADDPAVEPANDAQPEDEGGPADEGPLEREAMFVGLGDAVIPTVLVASATFFAPAGLPGVLGVPLTAVGAMVGTYVGLAGLVWMVLKGRAHAGLPLLNGGTIAGYLITAFVFGVPLTEALGIATYL